MSILKTIYCDLLKVSDRKGLLGFIKYYYFNRGYRSVLLYRLSNLLFSKKIRILPDLITAHSLSLTGADIAYTASIAPGLALLHPVGVVIGAGCTIGENCTIMQGVTLGAKWSKDGRIEFPKIGNNVVLGTGSKILGGITIGDNVIVGANAVVLSNIPQNSITVGIPAKFHELKKR